LADSRAARLCEESPDDTEGENAGNHQLIQKAGHLKTEKPCTIARTTKRAIGSASTSANSLNTTVPQILHRQVRPRMTRVGILRFLARRRPAEVTELVGLNDQHLGNANAADSFTR
jgi:hypothetical protein